MEKRIITLCYRKIIDINSTKAWEKLVFEDSYRELKMQAQLYDQGQKHHTFAELIQHIKGAEKLHFLVSGAIINYLRQLNAVVPDITNNIGKLFLNFKQFKFEIINSDLKNIAKHVVAVSFYSEPLIWHDTIASFLLTSPIKETEDNFTDLFTIQPFLTIHSIK